MAESLLAACVFSTAQKAEQVLFTDLVGSTMARAHEFVVHHIASKITENFQLSFGPAGGRKLFAGVTHLLRPYVRGFFCGQKSQFAVFGRNVSRNAAVVGNQRIIRS